MRNSLSFLLEQEGFTVVTFEDGPQLLQAMSKTRFDLFLLDVCMPEMDGFEATELIRHREKAVGGHIPIVAMTAYAMKGDRGRCLEANVP